MIQKFSKKELERLGCTEEEINLIMTYQRKFPIILNNENSVEKFCIDARNLWRELGCPQGQFNKWVERKLKTYGFIENIDFIALGQNCPTANGGYTISKEYNLSIDMAKQLSMIDKKEAGFIARRYFILMESIVQRNKDWWNTRNPERKVYNSMCNAVSESIFRHSGRSADKYDYSREANILNIIATGSEAQSIRNYFGLCGNELTRDSLERDYNEKLGFLQKQNIIYLGMNLPIAERVKLLIAAFDIIYPTASPVLPYLSKEDMNKARMSLLSNLNT